MWSRRELLRFGFPLWLAGRSSAANRATGFGQAKSVLVVFCGGGQSQLETWDPKPNAPIEVRGEFGSSATRLAGVRISDRLPRMASRVHRLTIVRSMTHDDLDHGSATYWALTGQAHIRKSSNPPIRPTDHPTWGSVLTRVRPARQLPYTAVHVNGPLLAPEEPAAGQNGGFLGRRFDPVLVGDVTEGASLARELEPNPTLPPQRLQARQELLRQLDRQFGSTESDRTALTDHAFELLGRPDVRRAFDLTQEPAKVREQYGLFRSGQACLLGRRLVEAGVPLVTVFFNHAIRGQDKINAPTETYGWDTHNDIFEALGKHLLPRFDHTFAALLDDLDERGLLDSTLVVGMGEFGRAPRVALEKNFAGSSPGRKHWAAAYSIVLAGAGIQRGSVYGSTNAQAGYVASDPVTPGDLTASIFHALGIDPQGHFDDFTGRPWPIATGQPVLGWW